MAGGLFDQILAAFGRLTDRERLLVGITVAVALVLGVLGGGYLISSSLEAKEKRVKIRREQLTEILGREALYKAAATREKKDARKLKGNNISLFSLLQKTAQELDLGLNDLNERETPVKNNTNVTEVSVDVNLKKVSVDKLNALLEKIEGPASRGLVKILKLKVSSRHDNNELLDVKMTVATWKASS